MPTRTKQSTQSSVLRASVTADTATDTGGPATILVDGADTAITANGLANYTPVPGDRLLVMKVGGMVEVIQFLSRGSVPWTGGVSVFRQDAEPTGSLSEGDIWYDTDDENHPYVYDGTTWQDARDGTIATAQSAADAAASEAATAQTDATNAATAASTAQTDANTALTNAATAQDAADAAQTDATNAATAASTAQTSADDAATAASTAQSAADAAQSDASTALTNAATAQSAADSAQTDADAANTAAAAAQSDADSAATEAASAAGIATSKADVLIQSATPAASYEAATTLWIDTTGGANTPKKWDSATSAWVVVTDKAATDAADAAVAAQSTADAASTAASTAQSAADAAQSDANTALTNAANAQSAADAAQADATTAITNAATAQSTADGKSTVTYSTSDATGTPDDGDVWFKFASGVVVAQWVGNGGSWVSATIDSAVIASLDVGKLTSGVLVADLISTVSTADTSLASPTGLTTSLPAEAGSLDPYSAYFYVVTAVDASGNESLPSNEALQVTDGTHREVELTWNRSTGAASYNVYQGTQGGGENLLIDTTPDPGSGTTVSHPDLGTYGIGFPIAQTPPGARLVLNSDGLTSYHASGSESLTIDSATGEVTATRLKLATGVDGEDATISHDDVFGGMQIIFTGPTTLTDPTPVQTGSLKSWSSADGSTAGTMVTGEKHMLLGVDEDLSNQLRLMLSTSTSDSFDIGIYARGNPGDRGGIQIDGGQGEVHISAGGTGVWLDGAKLIIDNTTDTSTGAGDSAPLKVGDPAGQHLRIDGNEIIAMTDSNSQGTISINGGGQTTVYHLVANNELHGDTIWSDTQPTTTSAANTRMGAAGKLSLVTSLSAEKLEQEPFTLEDARGLLSLTPITWYDRGEVEENDGSTEGLRRIAGVTAEDTREHAPVFTFDDAEGNLRGVEYDRIGVALIPLLKDALDRIAALEQRTA